MCCSCMDSPMSLKNPKDNALKPEFGSNQK
jgi:hypothetical protein